MITKRSGSQQQRAGKLKRENFKKIKEFTYKKMNRMHKNQHGLIKHPWVSNSGKPLTPPGKKEDGRGSNI